MAVPVITQQPTDKEGFARRIGYQNTVAATSDNGALSYEWRWASDDSPIPLATQADLDFIPKFVDSGRFVYCRVTNLDGFTDSDLAQIVIMRDPDLGLRNPHLSEHRTNPWTQIDAGAAWRQGQTINSFFARGCYGGGTSDAYSTFDQFVPVVPGVDMLLASWSMRSFADTDTAYTRYQFFEADKTTAIGSQIRFNAGPAANTVATLYQEVLLEAANFPAGAAWVRFRVEHDRNSGTSNNCSAPYMQVTYDPDNAEYLDGFGNFDPLWHCVANLLSLDGVNGATSAVDVGNAAATWNFSGTCALSNADSLFSSGTVARFNGDGWLVSTDVVMWPNAHQLDKTSAASNVNKAQTIEFWFKPDLAPTGSQGLLFVGNRGSNTQRTQIILNTVGDVYAYMESGSGGENVARVDGAVNFGQWNYLRIELGAPSMLQVNDAEPSIYAWQRSNSSSQQPLADGFHFGVARESNVLVYFEGYMANIRVTSGYRGGHRMPNLPARQFTTQQLDPLYDDLVIAHIRGYENANGSTTIVDNKGDFNWTPTNVAYTSAVQKFGGNTLQFTSGNLATTDCPELLFGANLGDGHLHVSMWVNWDGVSLTPLFFYGSPGLNNGRVQSRINADGTIQLYAANQANTVICNVNYTNALPGAGWYYMQITFSGRRCFVTANNGFVGNSTQMTASTSMDYDANPELRIGYSQSGTTGQNATAEFFDVRVTYSEDDTSVANRMLETGSQQGSAAAPFTYLPDRGSLPSSGPIIDTQPQSQTVEDQQNAVFTVAATSSGGALSYQWASVSAGDLPGETSDTLTVLADWDTNQGEGYFCKVTDDLGTTITDTAILTVGKIPLVLDLTPPPYPVPDLTTAQYAVSVTTGRGPFTYQWQDTGGDLVGEVGTTLDILADYLVNEGVGYGCKVTDYYGDELATPFSTMQIQQIALVITTQPQNQTVEDEQPATFSVVATGRGVTYQWYESTVAMPGEINPDVTVTADFFQSPAHTYQVELSDAYGNGQFSDLVTLTVDKIAPVFVGPEDLLVYDWEEAEFTSTVTAKLPITTLWYENGAPLAGETTDTYTIAQTPPGNDGYTYFLRATDGYGDEHDSPIATLTVQAVPILQTIDVRVLDPDGIWVSIMGDSGDQEPVNVIDDSAPFLDMTYSSAKIEEELALRVSWENFPHRLYGQYHHDVNLDGDLSQNAALVWNAELNKFILEWPTIWRGSWQPGIYYKGDQVESLGWLMTCAAVDGTEDPPHPTLTGAQDYIYTNSPSWASTSDNGVIHMSMTATVGPDDGALFEFLRVWPDAVGASISHYFRVTYRPFGPGGTEIIEVWNDPPLVAGQWNDLPLSNSAIPAGAEVQMDMFVIDDTGSTTYGPWGWDFAAGNSTVPAAGQWSRSNQQNELRLHKTDNDATDRSTDLANIGVGTTIEVEDTANALAFYTYLVTATPVDQTDYLEIPVQLFEQGQTIPAEADCDVTILVPGAAAANYVELAGHFPAGDPNWGTITTALAIDGVDQGAPATTGYPIDLGAAPARISEDWEYNAYSDIGTAPSAAISAQEFISYELGKGNEPAVVSTTNNTWTEIYRETIPTDVAYNVVIAIFAKRTDSFDFAKFTMGGIVWNDGGTAGDDVSTIAQSASANGLDARVVTSGADAIIEVRGLTMQNYDWTAHYFWSEIE